MQWHFFVLSRADVAELRLAQPAEVHVEACGHASFYSSCTRFCSVFASRKFSSTACLKLTSRITSCAWNSELLQGHPCRQGLLGSDALGTTVGPLGCTHLL